MICCQASLRYSSITEAMRTLSCYCFFFFWISPRQPAYALFPYTTLFRSIASVRSMTSDPPLGSHTLRSIALETCSSRDRKSTRLNSSHSSISYAVFCLKKKKLEPVDAGLLHLADDLLPGFLAVLLHHGGDEDLVLLLLLFLLDLAAPARVRALSLHDALPIYRLGAVDDQRPATRQPHLAVHCLGELLVKRSEEHTSELQSQFHLVCRLLLEKKKARTRRRRSPAPRG